MRNFKYLEFYVGNAKQAAHFYCSAFGFSGMHILAQKQVIKNVFLMF